MGDQMYIENDDDIYPELISQVKTIIDMNRPGIELLKIDRSKYGVTNFPECHIHDVFILSIEGSSFYAKGEDVYLRISSRYSLDYRNFLEFSLSLFQFDDCCVQERKICFLDEPDVAEVNFKRDDIQRRFSAIKCITDETQPGDIQDPKIRELFIFYLSRKDRLVEKDGAVYDDVVSHHGRDIIHEVLASVLGQLLGVPVPRNYFGYKSSRCKLAWINETHYAGPDSHRYVLSKAVGDKHPTHFLVKVLNKKFKERNIIWGLSLFREESNPLNLRFFQSRETADLQGLGNLIISQCSHYADLILSDFLDRLLGGTKDRKAYDYLLPEGLGGAIFTVDFGEILFPELMFEPGDPHYLAVKEEWASALKDYFRQIGELAPDNPYRKTSAELVLKVRKLDLRVISRLVNAIPEAFLLDHCENGQCCYQTATIVDFLENQFRIIMKQNALGACP
jgi:hypothetical protein